MSETGQVADAEAARGGGSTPGESAERLPLRTVLSYAVLAAPISAVGLPLVVYLPPFYASEVGISLAAVGAAFGLARIFDVITDPIAGVLQDMTRSRFGRRRVWVAAGLPIIMVAVWFTFNPPKNADLPYLYFCLLSLYTGFTMAVVSHLSWGAELSAHYHERSRLQGWREAMLVGGSLLVLAIPALVTGLGIGTQADGVRAMGWFVVLTLPVAAFFTLTQVKDPPPKPREPLHWKDALLALKNNKPFQTIALVELVSGFAPGITGALFIFFFNSVLDLGRLSTVLLFIYYTAALVGLPVWMRVSYRFGKKGAFIIANVWLAAAIACVGILPPGVFWMAAAGMSVAGFAAFASNFLMRAMVADVLDADQLATGEQRSGLFFGLVLLVAKTGLALAPLIAYPILEHFGFVAALGPNNSPTALSALFWMFLIVPVAGHLVMAALMWNFPIDAKAQAEMRAALEKAAS